MITPDSPYFAQARLLVRVLPFVGAEQCFALKGGTAINLFVRDMPRLSVDIDLAYLPEGDRAAALENIHAALGRIGAAAVAANPAWHFTFTRRQDGFAYAAQVSDDRALIKIEVTPVLRGCVYPEAPEESALLQRRCSVLRRSGRSPSRTCSPERSSPPWTGSIPATCTTSSFCSSAKD